VLTSTLRSGWLLEPELIIEEVHAMNNSTMRQFQFRAGDDVIAADGDKVGNLADLHGSYLVVEKGFFFPKDYYIPYSAVTSYDESDGKIYLSVTKDEALNSGWDQMPDIAADQYATGAYTSGDYVTPANTGTASTVDREDVRIPVHEEELVPTKTVREAGRVRVDKDVVEEEREVDVPVTEERVRVTRRAADRNATTGDTAFQEEEFEVPVRTEEAGVDKVVRVAEEIGISKEKVQDTKRVAGKVRKERVNVDESATDGSIYADRTAGEETASS
jgi:uncharacterized protein (TIGR02271 family)